MSNESKAEIISRWNFEVDDDGILVCHGYHDKSDHCESHMERISNHEVIEIINSLRSEVLELRSRLIN